MGQRVAFGALAILVLLAVFQVDVAIAENPDRGAGAVDDLLQRGSAVPLFFLVLLSFGARELGQLLRATGARPCMVFAHVMIVLLVLTPWLSAAGWLGHGPEAVEGLYWQIVWLVVAGLGTGLLLILRGRPSGTLRDAGATGLLIFYLGFLSSFGLQLRCDRDLPGYQGASLLLMTLLVIKASDIGAYFVGSTLGRHRLMPSISPAKSVEGALGGFLASGLLAVVFAHGDSVSVAMGLEPSSAARIGGELLLGGAQDHSVFSLTVRAFLFGGILSLVSQAGDLLESCFKRDADIKDSGRIMPQFGGILDLIDSPVLALPMAWLLMRVIWRIA